MLTLLVKLSEKLRMNITDRVRGLLVPVTVSKKRKADFENSSEESEIKIKKVKTEKLLNEERRNVLDVKGGNNNSEDQIQERPESSTLYENKVKVKVNGPLVPRLGTKTEKRSSRRLDTRNPYIHSSRAQGTPEEFNWSEEQLESLRTALEAYRHSPNMTVDRVARELMFPLKGNCSFSEEDIRLWLSQRCRYDSHKKNLLRKRKIEEGRWEMEGSLSKRLRKITFSERVQQKEYDRYGDSSAIANNLEPVFVSLKD